MARLPSNILRSTTRNESIFQHSPFAHLRESPEVLGQMEQATLQTRTTSSLRSVTAQVQNPCLTAFMTYKYKDLQLS